MDEKISTMDAAKDSKKESISQIETVASHTSSDEPPHARAPMTTQQWLAILALALSYMTAFQQGACSAAIVKSIDEALGEWGLRNTQSSS
jgi:hypothetical protein